jgi:hypothetical protein
MTSGQVIFRIYLTWFKRFYKTMRPHQMCEQVTERKANSRRSVEFKAQVVSMIGLQAKQL